MALFGRVIPQKPQWQESSSEDEATEPSLLGFAEEVEAGRGEFEAEAGEGA